MARSARYGTRRSTAISRLELVEPALCADDVGLGEHGRLDGERHGVQGGRAWERSACPLRRRRGARRGDACRRRAARGETLYG